MERTFGIVLAVLAAAIAACVEDEEFPTEGAIVSLSCIDDGAVCDPPETHGATVTGTELDACNYWDSSRNFRVRFIGPSSEIIVEIANFTGEGSYATSTDGTTNVTMGGEGDVPSLADASSGTEGCTITVESNLDDIRIPETGDAPRLDVSLDVTCPTLYAGGVCDAVCTPTPGSFSLSVGGCIVSQ
jgi:hypothetical protein